MMFLTEAKLFDIVKKQFKYKLSASFSVFSSLIIIQTIGLFFSLNGSGTMGTASYGMDYTISILTGDIIIIFTMLWSFISAITLTTKNYRNEDFLFVSNRLSSSLANVLFLGAISVIGGTTSILASMLLKIGVFLIMNEGRTYGYVMNIQELFLGVFTCILYVFLLAALGYLIGMLTQISRWFSIILPALFIGYLIIGANEDGEATAIIQAISFFGSESSMILFFLKVVVTTSLLFTLSIILSNKMEVRR